MFNKLLNRSRNNQQEEKQGFICPECKKDFSSIEDLSDHHIRAHPPADYEESFQPIEIEPPNSSLLFNNDDKTAQIKQEIADLGISLQEESWYAAELQKELVRVQQENQALKSSVNSRSGSAQVDIVSKKAADLAVLVAHLSAELDDERSKSAGFEDNLAKLQQTNEELCESQMSLQAKLNQSTSTDDVEVLKQELAKSQVQLDAILASGEKDVALLQERIDTLVKQGDRLEETVKSKEKSIETYVNENKILTSDVARLQGSIQQHALTQRMSDSQVSQHSARIQELETLCTRYRDDVKRKDEEKNVLFEKFNGFNSTLNQLNSQIGRDDESMNTEMKQLADNFSEFQISLQEKDKRNSELSTEIAALQRELSSFKAQCATLETQYTLSEQNCASLNSKISSLEEVTRTKDDELLKKGYQIKELESELQSSLSKITQAEATLLFTEKEKTSLEEEKRGLQEANTLVEEEIKELKEGKRALEEENIRARAEDDVRHKQQCDELYQLDFKLTSLRNEHSEVSLSYAKLKEDHVLASGQVMELRRRVEELEQGLQSKEDQVKSFTNEIIDLKQQLLDVNKEKEEFKNTICSVEKQLELSTCCVGELNTRIERKDESLLELNKKLQKLEVDLAKPCTMCINYENKLNKSYIRIQDLESESESQKEKLSVLESEVNEYSEHVQTTSEKLHVVEYNLEREKENAMNTEAALKETRDQLKDSTDLLAGKVKLLEEQLEEAQDTSSKAETVNRELSALRQRLEQELSETERALKESSEMHGKELEDLTNKNALLIAHKMKLHEEIQLITENMEHTTAQLAVSKEQYSELKEELEIQSQSHRIELGQADQRTEDLSRELIHASSSHEAAMTENNNELCGVKQKLRDSQGVVEELNKECERLYGKVNVNEVTMENLLDERKLLMKSVLDSEERLTKLNQDNVKLVHDLEKTQTTLNEIAQEHSHLIYLQEKKLNRKWEDDSDAENCKSCGKEFGVSLRKHHCRNCGGIFCDACSKHRSSTASSKAKLRVCGSCNKELNPGP